MSKDAVKEEEIQTLEEKKEEVKVEENKVEESKTQLESFILEEKEKRLLAKKLVDDEEKYNALETKYNEMQKQLEKMTKQLEEKSKIIDSQITGTNEDKDSNLTPWEKIMKLNKRN